MPLPHLETVQELITLIKIDIPNSDTLRFHNWGGSNEYIYANETYTFIGIELGSTTASLGLENEGFTATLATSDQLLSFYRETDGLKGSLVTLTTLWPGRPDGEPVIQRLEISHAGSDGPVVYFVLRSPLSAVGSGIANRFYSLREYRELPTSSDASLR